MGTLNTKHCQTGRLWWEDGASTNGAYLDGGHGTGDVEVLSLWSTALHEGDAVGTGNVLSRVLWCVCVCVCVCVSE